MLAWGYFQILFENALQGRLHIAQEEFSHVSRAKHEVLQQDSHDLKGKIVDVKKSHDMPTAILIHSNVVQILRKCFFFWDNVF